MACSVWLQKKLRVLRIERDANVNHVKELDNERAREISTDPLMKYSSVLSGVFYKRVIICEGDSDCTFYNSILHLSDICGKYYPDVSFLFMQVERTECINWQKP